MDGSIAELAQYRFERAKEELDNAQAMLEMKRYKLALNRSYYSIFHAMRAVNVTDGFDSSKHSGVIAHFNQYFVKTGVFPKEVSKMIRNASAMREQADYEDFFIASQREAEKQVEDAKKVLAFVGEFLQENSTKDS